MAGLLSADYPRAGIDGSLTVILAAQEHHREPIGPSLRRYRRFGAGGRSRAGGPCDAARLAVLADPARRPAPVLERRSSRGSPRASHDRGWLGPGTRGTMRPP